MSLAVVLLALGISKKYASSIAFVSFFNRPPLSDLTAGLLLGFYLASSGRCLKGRNRNKRLDGRRGLCTRTPGQPASSAHLGLISAPQEH